MANVDNPHGLMSLGKTLSGGHPQIEEFLKAVGYGTAIFPGDAVNQVADGSIDKSATPGTTAYSGVALTGGAASTATAHICIVSPDAVFEAQDDGDSATLAATDIGLNANLILGAGSASLNRSGHEVDTSTAAVTATLDVKILRLFKIPTVQNDWGINVRLEIAFNKHRMAPGVVGI